MDNIKNELERPSLSVVPSPLPPLQVASALSHSGEIELQGEVGQKARPIDPDFLWKTHDYIGEYVRFSDAKAAIVLTISGALIGSLWTIKAHDLFLNTPIRQWSGATWLSLVSFLALAASMISGISAIAPRFWKGKTRNPVFWDGVVEYGSAEAYFDWFRSQDRSSLARELAHQVFSLSLVCSAKYRSTAWSIYLLLLGALSSAIYLLG